MVTSKGVVLQRQTEDGVTVNASSEAMVVAEGAEGGQATVVGGVRGTALQSGVTGGRGLFESPPLGVASDVAAIPTTQQSEARSESEWGKGVLGGRGGWGSAAGENSK